MVNQNTPLFSFGIIADVQFCDCDPAMDRYYRNSTQKLADALDHLHQYELAFILDLGDLIDRNFTNFEKMLTIYASSKFRVYRVVGNHDFSVEDHQKTKVAQQLGLDPLAYYDFVYLGWRIIMLNGCELSTFAHPAGSEEDKAGRQMLQQLESTGAAHAKPWNGGMSSSQMQWLESRLQAAKRAGQKVVVCNHYPVYPPDPHNLWNDKALVQLLESYPQVVAYFNGHNHAGNYGQKEHVHFLNFKGMVDTQEENTYAMVQVYPNKLEVVGFGRENNRSLLIL